MAWPDLVYRTRRRPARFRLTLKQSIGAAGAIAAYAATVQDAREAMIDRQARAWRGKKGRDGEVRYRG